MKRFALIGKNINKSLSPAIHHYCFGRLLLDAKYEIININRADKISGVIDQLKSGDLDGVNVTTPYKENIKLHLDQINPRAEEIGSINCIHVKSGKLIGNNTDWYGFLKALEGMGTFNNVVIFGTGGVVPAILYYFNNRETMPIHIVGRNKERMSFFKSRGASIYNMENLNVNIDSPLIINTIPSNASINWKDLINRVSKNICAAMDLNYNFKVTEFLNSFNSDVKIKNGLDMLIYQALMSLDIWHEKDLSSSININDLKMNIECLDE